MALVVTSAPLEDDFELTPHARDVLRRADIEVVADAGAAGRALAEGEVLVAGISTETSDPLTLARAMPRLRWLHTMTAGLGSLVSSDLAEREVIVTNASGVYAPAIAEYAFAALVLLARRLPELLVADAERVWRDHALGAELAGRRAGIVGYGGIGRRVATLCRAAGMEVWATRRRAAVADRGDAHRVWPPDRLDEMLAACHAIVLATSLNPSTRDLIGARELALLPPGATLVNVSRGEVVDEHALAAALHSGALAGAVLDVTREEPLPPHSPLWRVPNLWITPHMAGGTRESRARSLEFLVANLDRYLAGDLAALANVVDLRRELGAT